MNPGEGCKNSFKSYQSGVVNPVLYILSHDFRGMGRVDLA